MFCYSIKWLISFEWCHHRKKCNLNIQYCIVNHDLICFYWWFSHTNIRSYIGAAHLQLQIHVLPEQTMNVWEKEKQEIEMLIFYYIIICIIIIMEVNAHNVPQMNVNTYRWIENQLNADVMISVSIRFIASINFLFYFLYFNLPFIFADLMRLYIPFCFQLDNFMCYLYRQCTKIIPNRYMKKNITHTHTHKCTNNNRYYTWKKKKKSVFNSIPTICSGSH